MNWYVLSVVTAALSAMMPMTDHVAATRMSSAPSISMNPCGMRPFQTTPPDISRPPDI
jgi:hypothetical protein